MGNIFSRLQKDKKQETVEQLREVRPIEIQQNLNSEAAQFKLAKIMQSGTNFERRAYGCVLGAFIGDALGSFHEFQQNVSEQLIETVMKQPGGGTFDLLPGQVTDDSELALSLAYGLIQGAGVLNRDLIALYYGIWINSQPFDCGNTINAAFSNLAKAKPLKSWSVEQCQQKNLASQAILAARQSNQKSESNGCLMRISPLIIFCLNLTSDQDIINAVEAEVQLTHPNQIVLDACKAFVLTCVEVIRTGDPEKGYEKGKQFILGYACQQLKNQWWTETVEEEQYMLATQNMGWAKIAWSYSYFYLKRWQSIYQNDIKNAYYNILREVMKQGGDTDTNACIVGTMVGALVGIDNLPSNYLNNLLKCDVLNQIEKEMNPILRGKAYSSVNKFCNFPREITYHTHNLTFLG